jgi:hypothetical protein
VLNGPGGKGLVDVLISGKQTVLPPSIHPDTGNPYLWIGKPLLEWETAELPRISADDINLLKAIVGSQEASQLTTGQTTHDAGLRLAAILVRHSESDEKLLDIFRALLPENYDGDSLKEAPGWIVSARRKGFDKVGKAPIDETAALIVEKELDPLKFTVRDGFLQYQDGHWKTVPRNSIHRHLKGHLTTMVGPKSQVSGILTGAERCLALNVEDEDFGKPEGKICLNCPSSEDLAQMGARISGVRASSWG